MMVPFSSHPLALTINKYQILLFDIDFLSVFPEIFLLLVGMTYLLYGVVWSTSKEKNYPMLLHNISWLTLVALVYTVFLLVNNPIDHAVFFYNT